MHKLRHNLTNNYYAKYLLVITSITGGYLALMLLDFTSHNTHHTTCFFKLATTIPCPGCGMGRATLQLMQGNILSSLQYNLLCIPFTIAVAISLFLAASDLIKGKSNLLNVLRKPFPPKLQLICLSVIVINWIINIIRDI